MTRSIPEGQVAPARSRVHNQWAEHTPGKQHTEKERLEMVRAEREGWVKGNCDGAKVTSHIAWTSRGGSRERGKGNGEESGWGGGDEGAG